jgi:hypothetical protein
LRCVGDNGADSSGKGGKSVIGQLAQVLIEVVIAADILDRGKGRGFVFDDTPGSVVRQLQMALHVGFFGWRIFPDNFSIRPGSLFLDYADLPHMEIHAQAHDRYRLWRFLPAGVQAVAVVILLFQVGDPARKVWF